MYGLLLSCVILYGISSYYLVFFMCFYGKIWIWLDLNRLFRGHRSKFIWSYFCKSLDLKLFLYIFFVFRLGDFWRLELQRPNRAEVLRRCRILIRQCKFSELATNDSMQALRYLHTSLASIVNHSNPQEEREVRKYVLLHHTLGRFALYVRFT